MQEIRVTFRIRDVRCAPRPIGERSAFATDLSKTRRVSFKLVAKPKTRRVSLRTVRRSSKLAKDGAPDVRLNASLTSKSIQAPYRCRNGGECTNI